MVPYAASPTPTIARAASRLAKFQARPPSAVATLQIVTPRAMSLGRERVSPNAPNNRRRRHVDDDEAAAEQAVLQIADVQRRMAQRLGDRGDDVAVDVVEKVDQREDDEP